MAMDLERKEGRLHFSLGPVERWIVAIGASVILGAGYWFVSSVMIRLDKQADGMAKLATAQAVTNSQLTTLNLQLADVPSLTRKLAEHDVRIDRLESDTKELREIRGLR